MALQTPKKLLVFMPPLTLGGMERMVVNLLNRLDREKFSTTLVLVGSEGGEMLMGQLNKDIDVVDLGCTSLRRAVADYIRVARQMRPDIIFSTIMHLNFAVLFTCWLVPGRPRLVARESIFVSSHLEEVPATAMWKMATRLFYRFFDLLICQSQAMADDLHEAFQTPGGMLQVIHNPVDREILVQRAKAPVSVIVPKEENGNGKLVVVGRLATVKQVDGIIRALSLLGGSAPNLWIIGDGPLRHELEQLARSLNLGESVTFAGEQENPYPYIAAADALVINSKHEVFPNVVLEALALRKPVIAAPARGGLPEILDSVEASFVATDTTPEALAHAIRRWQVVRHDVSVPADCVAQYDPAMITAQYERALLGELAKDKV